MKKKNVSDIMEATVEIGAKIVLDDWHRTTKQYKRLYDGFPETTSVLKNKEIANYKFMNWLVDNIFTNKYIRFEKMGQPKKHRKTATEAVMEAKIELDKKLCDIFNNGFNTTEIYQPPIPTLFPKGGNMFNRKLKKRIYDLENNNYRLEDEIEILKKVFKKSGLYDGLYYYKPIIDLNRLKERVDKIVEYLGIEMKEINEKKFVKKTRKVVKKGKPKSKKKK